MSYMQRQLVLYLLGALLVACATWWWFYAMEKKWNARIEISEEAQKNPMLAAERLLAQHRHAVKTQSTLGEALLNTTSAATPGTLVIAENGGIMTPDQARQLLGWVRKGNTLVIRPESPRNQAAAESKTPTGGKDKGKPQAEFQKLVETDPIGAYLGVTLDETCSCQTNSKQSDAKTTSPKTENDQKETGQTGTDDAERDEAKEKTPTITLPNAAYPLQLSTGYARLKTTKDGFTPLSSDDTGEAIRIYAEGKGHIALLSQNYFYNDRLANYDQAELLLGLAELGSKAGPVFIVQHLDMPSWYRLLWTSFKLGIIGLACGLLLLFWRAVRRFGPLLPEPDHNRRSLIEHIDASGRWLWKVPGGRDILLAAVRVSTDQVLQRRAPELQRLPFAEKINLMARYCKLDKTDLASALQQGASRSPLVFTRQIQTLQQLRKHYER